MVLLDTIAKENQQQNNNNNNPKINEICNKTYTKITNNNNNSNNNNNNGKFNNINNKICNHHEFDKITLRSNTITLLSTTKNLIAINNCIDSINKSNLCNLNSNEINYRILKLIKNKNHTNYDNSKESLLNSSISFVLIKFIFTSTLLLDSLEKSLLNNNNYNICYNSSNNIIIRRTVLNVNTAKHKTNSLKFIPITAITPFLYEKLLHEKLIKQQLQKNDNNLIYKAFDEPFNEQHFHHHYQYHSHQKCHHPRYQKEKQTVAKTLETSSRIAIKTSTKQKLIRREKTTSLLSSSTIIKQIASVVFAAVAILIVHLQRFFYGLNKYSWIFLLIYLNFSAKFCIGGYHEKRLLHDLLDPYNTLERPVLNESDPLQLSFGLTLMQIIDVDEKNQLLITNVWLKLEWNDMNLRWNTSEYGGVKDLRIPPHRIWKPDVLMYNSADEGFDGTYQTNVVVRSNGSCLYVPPGIFKSTCKIDITWFPFDDQRCEMKFGSWTYDGFQLDLQLQDETGGDISSYVLNGEWELLGVPGKRNEIYYNCCPEPYIDITFAIIIRRRTLYYFFNLIIPCVLIASMALLGFTLPPDSGEKLSLGVTILLSLTVFLNMVAETMPATSDAVPLLGTYFNCIMFMVASSVVSTILILNYHHRNADTHEMSEWVRIVFLCWLPWILRMSRPGKPVTLEFPPTPCSDTSSERKHQILSDVELKERSSKSLLANVLDIDDDFRHSCRPLTPSGGTLPHNPAFYRTVYGQGDDGSIGPIGSTRMPDAITQHTCIKSSTDYELSLILKELRFITDQLRKEDEDTDISNDWKFAAMVVDRLCLIIFTMFTILATIAVLLSAPHIIVS